MQIEFQTSFYHEL